MFPLTIPLFRVDYYVFGDIPGSNFTMCAIRNPLKVEKMQLPFSMKPFVTFFELNKVGSMRIINEIQLSIGRDPEL
jgi:hypothetical protein